MFKKIVKICRIHETISVKVSQTIAEFMKSHICAKIGEMEHLLKLCWAHVKFCSLAFYKYFQKYVCQLSWITYQFLRKWSVF